LQKSGLCGDDRIPRAHSIIVILVGGCLVALIIYLAFRGLGRPLEAPAEPAGRSLRNTWRMPPLAELSPRELTTLNRVWLFVLRAYLIVAAGLVLARIVTLATAAV
jgi:hypothetical protein